MVTIMDGTCVKCKEYLHDCICHVKNKLRKHATEWDRSRQRYECRLCGGDHKEVQCNDADFASREN